MRQGESLGASPASREDDRVSEDLLRSLEEDEAGPPAHLVAGILSRVRRALGLRDLFDGLAMGPVRAFVGALGRRVSDDTRERHGSGDSSD